MGQPQGISALYSWAGKERTSVIFVTVKRLIH